MKKRIFKLPVKWVMIGVQEIEANSLQQAIMIAENSNLELPHQCEYLDGTYEIDKEVIEIVKREKGKGALERNDVLNI
jgi:hypothetical protein